MRVRHFVLIVSAGMAGFAFAGQGCGGTSDSGPAGTDASVQDVTAADTTQPPKDTGAPDLGTPETAPDNCPDADLANPNLPDASLADGATSVGECLSCVESKCQAEVTACNDTTTDCSCKQLIYDFLSCVSGGKSIFSCGSSLVVGAPQTAQDLGLCVYGNCIKDCAPTFDASVLDAPQDTGGGG
jgi:hypothetical protein